jgi:hypothetical protein
VYGVRAIDYVNRFIISGGDVMKDIITYCGYICLRMIRCFKDSNVGFTNHEISKRDIEDMRLMDNHFTGHGYISYVMFKGKTYKVEVTEHKIKKAKKPLYCNELLNKGGM